jgi:hypothetical protein
MYLVYCVLIIVLLVVLLLWVYYYYSATSLPTSNPGVLYSRCDEEGGCQNGLTCDQECGRCKNTLGRPCALDSDCQQGLVCRQWVCVDDSFTPTEDPPVPPKPPKSGKKIRWADQ